MLERLQGWLPWQQGRDTLRQPVDVQAPLPDYRDRISVTTWLIVFGLGLSTLFKLQNTIRWEFLAFNSPVSFRMTEQGIAAVFLALMAAAGAQSVVSVHPRLASRSSTRLSMQRSALRRTWMYWALPMALTIIATLLIHQRGPDSFVPSGPLLVLSIIVSGAIFALSLFCLYATVEPGQLGFRRSRLVLNALAYMSALLLFAFVYQTRTRSLLSSSIIAVTAMFLAVEMLRNTTERPELVFTYSVIVGLILGQVTWALNYMSTVPDLTGGLLLLLIFYLTVGLAQQGLQERITRRVLWEFTIFTVVALVLIAIVGPGFG